MRIADWLDGTAWIRHPRGSLFRNPNSAFRNGVCRPAVLVDSPAARTVRCLIGAAPERHQQGARRVERGEAGNAVLHRGAAQEGSLPLRLLVLRDRVYEQMRAAGADDIHQRFAPLLE